MSADDDAASVRGSAGGHGDKDGDGKRWLWVIASIRNFGEAICQMYIDSIEYLRGVDADCGIPVRYLSQVGLVPAGNDKMALNLRRYMPHVIGFVDKDSEGLLFKRDIMFIWKATSDAALKGYESYHPKMIKEVRGEEAKKVLDLSTMRK